ncbi:MAG TPA: restriction endonuclease [Spirochaetia bacterium]|nr:restriction endonuclease [Spirochaetia bacterium]
MNESATKYFKEYKSKLGFTNQNQAKDYLAAKNITPSVDYKYIACLNDRIIDILKKINSIIHVDSQRKDLDDFIKMKVFIVYQTIKKNDIIPRLNNQGRRPEEVLFSWLRGFVISEYFSPSISKIFSIKIDSILKIGDDDFNNIDTFKRSPQADLKFVKNGKTVRIEVQSGFQGINDIKQHKVLEAKRIFNQLGDLTVCVHFDLFNGQVAFVRLDNIDDNDINWVTRQQMEGQTVFSIDQNLFEWRLLDSIPKYSDLSIEI